MEWAESKNTLYVLLSAVAAAFLSFIILYPESTKLTLVLCMVPIFVFAAYLTIGVKESLLYLLVALIPFQIGKFFVHPQYAEVFTAVQIIDLIVMGLYAIWIFEAISGRAEKALNVDRFIAGCLSALVALSLISCLHAVSRRVALYQTFSLIRCILIFLYVAYRPLKKRDIFFIIVIILAGVIFQGMIGLLQWMKGAPLGLSFLGEPVRPWMQKLNIVIVYRISGTLPSQNMLWFMFMDFTLPLIAALFFYYRNLILKAVLLGIFAFGVYVSFLTFSRGGWISFSVAMFVLFFLYLFKRPFKIWTLLKTLLIIGMMLIPVIFMYDLIIARIVSHDFGSFEMRKPLMQIALYIIRTYPFAGIGAGNYILIMHLFDVSIRGITHYFFYPVHNLYLYIAAETGIFSLIAYILFIAAVLLKGWRALPRLPETIAVPIVIGILSGLFAFCVHSLVESISLGRLIMLWFSCGLLVNLARPFLDRRVPS